MNVLLADDDKLFLLLHKKALQRGGFNGALFYAQDGEVALKLLQAKPENQDSWLILLDINMPVMDGWQFLEAVQGAPFATSLSVVMVTSSIDGADRDRAEQYPMVVDYLEKPLTQEAVKSLLNRFQPATRRTVLPEERNQS